MLADLQRIYAFAQFCNAAGSFVPPIPGSMTGLSVRMHLAAAQRRHHGLNQYFARPRLGHGHIFKPKNVWLAELVDANRFHAPTISALPPAIKPPRSPRPASQSSGATS
jgi:hypothetical protein